MPRWVPWAVTAFIWSLVILQFVRATLYYRRAARTGLLGRKVLSAHVTADLVSFGLALGFFYALHHLISRWFLTAGLGIGSTELFILYAVLSLPLAWLLGRLYRRFIDPRVRDFLAREPEGISQEADLS